MPPFAGLQDTRIPDGVPMKVSRGFANGKLTEELLLGLRGLLHGHVNAPAGRDTARRGGSRGKKKRLRGRNDEDEDEDGDEEDEAEADD